MVEDSRFTTRRPARCAIVTECDAAASEEQNFWQVWQQHRARLLVVCLEVMHGNQADAEDALDGVMLRAMEKFPLYRESIADPAAWLSRLARNLCIDLQRSRGRRARCESPLRETAEDEDAATQVSESGVSATLRAELQDRLHEMIDRLPSRLRECFRLRVIAQLGYKQIAAELALSVDCARKRVQEARVVLRQSRHELLGSRELPLAERPSRPASAALRPAAAPGAADYRLLRIRLPRGGEISVPIQLARKPARERQRIATLGAYIQHHPGGWKRRAEFAALLYETGRWTEAIEAYRAVVAKRPWLTDAALRLSTMLHLTGQAGEAVKVLERTAEAPGPSTAQHHHLSGVLALWKRDVPRALAELAQAAALEPRAAVHWHALAHAHWIAGDTAATLQAIDAALALNPHDLVALEQSHDPLLRAGRYQDVRDRLLHVLEIVPDNAAALHCLAEYCRHRPPVLEPPVALRLPWRRRTTAR